MRTGRGDFPVTEAARTLADAIAGDDRALDRALELPLDVITEQRLSSVIARRAREQGRAMSTGLRKAELVSAAHWMILEQTLGAVDESLRGVGGARAFFKGADLANRVYRWREDRPASDVDLLVEASSFEAARRSLERAGFVALYSGPHAERYLEDEGYAWQAQREGSAMVELHHRLWGLAPSRFAAHLLSTVTPHPEYDGFGELSLGAAWLVSAVHLWLHPPPRGLLAFWDLERIADAALDDPAFRPTVMSLARHHDLQLPVVLAAYLTHALWRRPLHLGLAVDLVPDLRPPERLVLARARRGGEAAVSPATFPLARLLSARRSRAGLRVLWRRFWPHPGVVEQLTAPGPWWQRRLSLLLRRRAG